MLPLDTGPYAETVIGTKPSDGETTTDNEGGIKEVIIGCIAVILSIPLVTFMGLFIFSYLVLILIIGPIVVGFWACARYGTEYGILHRLRYRATKAGKAKAKARISDPNKF